MLKRWTKRLLKVLLVLAALLVVFLLFERVRGQISLSRYKQKLIAQGEKLSPQDFVQSFSEADNGAPEAIALIESLKDGVLLPHSYPPAMKLVPSGRAVVCFRESEWVESGAYRNGEWVSGTVTNHWDELAADLKANETTLAEIRAALEKPILNNRLDLSEGANLKMAHLAVAKNLTHWLGAGVQLSLREGRTHEALKYLLVEICLPRIAVEDRTFLSELVRVAIEGVAKSHTWEALQAEGWSDQDLAVLQKAWQDREFADEMAHSFEGERVYCDVMMQQFKEDPQGVLLWSEDMVLEFSELPVWERVKSRIGHGIWRFAWSYQDQRHALENLQWLITIMRDAAERKSYRAVLPEVERFGHFRQNVTFYDSCRFWLSEMVLGAFRRAPEKAMWAETDRALSITAIALERYALRHGKFPPSLDALVPDFLAAVPIDYMDGKALKYQLNSDGSFTLYSVGADGKDDRGDASPTTEKATRNLWQRRDYIWPSPALPEEVEAWRKEAVEG